MPYCLFDNLEETDQARLEEYKHRVAPIVHQFGGRYVVLGGHVDLVEGDWASTIAVQWLEGASWRIRSRSVCPQRSVAHFGKHLAASAADLRTLSAWRRVAER